MPEDLYFSEREAGELPRDTPEISQTFWAGFVALVQRLMADGSLAEKFPGDPCPDPPYAIICCDRGSVGDAFRGENPGIEWPLQPDGLPGTLAALDGVQFFFRYVSEPMFRKVHDYFAHEHLTRFNEYRAQESYRAEVNRLFRRNRHPYELGANGKVTRIGPPVLRETLRATTFQTGDSELDALLESARTKFNRPEANLRRESLEKLWDAWERLKTLCHPDKKQGIQTMLLDSVPEQELRQRIDEEAQKLTKIGNDFRIRHHERDKIPIENDEQIDYLFHRMFALIWLLLKATHRLGQ